MAQRDEFSEFDDTLGGGSTMPPPPPPAKGDEKGEPGGNREPSPAEERIRQLTQERNEARRLRDEAIRKMLDGAQQPTQEPDTGEKVTDDDYDFIVKSLPSDADPEVADVLKPVLSAYERRIEERVKQDFESRYGPVLSAAEREQNIDLVDQRVEGFREHYMDDVEKMFRELPPEMQAEYDNRLGIEVLALRSKIERMSRGEELSGMAHSTPSGVTPPDRPKGITADTVWDMPDEQFDAWMQRIKMSAGR